MIENTRINNFDKVKHTIVEHIGTDLGEEELHFLNLTLQYYSDILISDHGLNFYKRHVGLFSFYMNCYEIAFIFNMNTTSDTSEMVIDMDYTTPIKTVYIYGVGEVS